MNARILKRERTELEKARRHKYGDGGGKVSKGKRWIISRDFLSNTITTVTKDNIPIEEYEKIHSNRNNKEWNRSNNSCENMEDREQ